MKPNPPKWHGRLRTERGFALVISLSLMVLLTVLAVGLLTLSTISLRGSGTAEARAEAQANARLGLTLAIGELQSGLGPDRSISARASSLDENASDPNLVGAWESWRWQPGANGPNYGEKSEKFRGWLVSTSEPRDALNTSLPTTGVSDPVWLLNPATVGGSGSGMGSGLRASKVNVQSSENRFGTMAWAVMDESMKAPIQLEEREPQNDAERLAHRVAPTRARPEEILPVLAPTTLKPEKVISLESAVVSVGKEQGAQILTQQADITPYSLGLLTDTVEGGFKTDLTSLFEDSSVSANVNGQPTLYNTISDGAPRWDYLRNHYQLYRRVTGASDGKPSITLNADDLRIQSNGLRQSPDVERMMPVIAKLQLMFSVVSHHAHIQPRVNFYDTKGSPRGNNNYASPHLVYDPVITLYNPYDVALDLTKIRVRIWDPPVVFGMKKNNIWLRNEFASGEFHGLARFQIANQRNKDARRFFSFLLSDLQTNRRPGKRITLQPGEVKVFSPWVETDWTWGKETAGGFTPYCFFDWDAGLTFGNRDSRTGNAFGVETVPGWDPRAGLQTDHLSYSESMRPQATFYDFELPDMRNEGWLVIKLADTFGVEAKPGRTIENRSEPDFVVDLLSGTRNDSNNLLNTSIDMLRTYRFRLQDPVGELSSNPTNPIIKRNFRVSQLLQRPTDRSVGGKSPFAILSMTAKTTKTALDYSMPWLHNHPVVEGVEQTSSRVGNALDSYDLRFEEVTDFNANPGGIEFDTQNRGYYGATPYSQGGVSNVPMFRVPVMPAVSLGDFVTANLISSSHLPRVTHAFGNSRAHPLIPSGSVTRRAPTDAQGITIRQAYDMLDHSYLINDALWDRTFFSTAASFTGGLAPSTPRRTLLEQFLNGERKLLNPRLVPILASTGSVDQTVTQLESGGSEGLALRMAGIMGIDGPFNVNSDSVPAWKALLASLRDAELRGWTMSDLSPEDKTGFPRFGLPIAGDPDQTPKSAGIDLAGMVRWAGFRALDDQQIDQLANRIVEEIRIRGRQDSAPSLSLAEFVNRRIGGANGIQTKAGLLQTAIDNSGVNNDYHRLDSKDLTTSQPTSSSALNGMLNADARAGMSAEGAPSMLTQGDLLMALAPIITVRGDTFRIRSYGESKAADGSVQAKAWCEAIVQRLPEYLDPEDEAQDKEAQLSSEANIRFGRRFVITSFRWLSPEEV